MCSQINFDRITTDGTGTTREIENYLLRVVLLVVGTIYTKFRKDAFKKY